MIKIASMEWIQIQIQVTDESLKEALSSFLFDLGAGGVSETVDRGVSKGICACFPKNQEQEICEKLTSYLEALKPLSPSFPKIEWKLTEVPQDNWAEKYKEFYKAQKLTNRFFLRPQWDQQTAIPSDMFPLILDPGQAFGTGLHQSTKLSMKLIEDTAALYSDVSPLQILDVGTGTGILSIVASKIGFQQVTAIDNDPDAIRVAQENFVTNGTQSILLSPEAIQSLKPAFDVIVSNILLETHLELASEYRRLLKPGGILILAGLLGGQIELLQKHIFSLGFVSLQKSLLQEWAAASYTLRTKP